VREWTNGRGQKVTSIKRAAKKGVDRAKHLGIFKSHLKGEARRGSKEGHKETVAKSADRRCSSQVVVDQDEKRIRGGGILGKCTSSGRYGAICGRGREKWVPNGRLTEGINDPRLKPKILKNVRLGTLDHWSDMYKIPQELGEGSLLENGGDKRSFRRG